MTFESRPFCKGIFHLCAGIIYIIMTPILFHIVPCDLMLPISVYLLSVICHLIGYIQRIDHIMIFGLIFGTYYAIISSLPIKVNWLIKFVLSIGILLGVFHQICYSNTSNIIIALPYLILSSSIMLDTNIINHIIHNLPRGFIIIIIGCGFYIIGAIIYITRYPSLSPTFIGYHELLHIFTMIGTIMHSYFIFFQLIPYYILLNTTAPII